MENSGDMEQGETNPETEKGEKQRLNPFVCGLCDCSYGQFVSFYKHFKIHSNEVGVGQDSFHICEDLPSSERDVCEDQSESLEMQTFNCGICPASFITVCILHEHMEKHESKGSYTLDMQSRTGYPRSKQFPCVSLGSHLSDVTLSKSGVKAKRDSPSKRGLSGNTVSMPDSAVRNKRARPSNDETSPEIQIGTKKGRYSKHESPQRNTVASEAQVKTRRGRSSRHGGASSPETKIKAGKDRQTRHKPSKDTISTPVSKVKSGPVKHARKNVSIKSEPVETLNENWLEKVTDKTQDDGKVYVDHAEDMFNDNDSNMAIEDDGMDNFDDGFDAYDDDEEDAARAGQEDMKSAGQAPSDKAESPHTEAGSLKTEAEVEDNVAGESAEAEEQYNFRRKRISQPRVKPSAKKKVSGKKKKNFLFCEVCGMKRAEHLLVKHVEETHGGVELSKEFRLTLSELKCAEQPRKKYVKKSKDEQLDDSDYEPPENEYLPSQNNKVKRTDLLQTNRYGNKVTFIKCKDCGLMIGTRNVNAHKRAHKRYPDKYKPENMQTCEKCDRVFLKESFNKHICFDVETKVVKKTVKQECIIEEGEKDRIIYYMDGRKHKNRPFTKCKHCEMLIRLTKIGKHEKMHLTYRGKRKYRPEELTKCEYCSRVLFHRHLHRHHCVLVYQKDVAGEREEDGAEGPAKKKKPPILPCDVCGEMVIRYRMKKHMQYHSDDFPFTCSKCPKAYKAIDSLRSHEQTVHTERKFRCDQCPWTFPSMSRLTKHYRQHTGERPFSCEICDKSFAQKDNMESHRNTHSEGFNFHCKECPSRFKMKKTLDCHIRTRHRQLRQWVCSWPDCGKLFYSGSILRRHMIIHTGEKPEQCPHCELAFTQRQELKSHMVRRHNISKLPPPSLETPYMNAVPIIIKRPASGEDTDKTDSSNTFKTLSFSSGMSEAESQKLQDQLALQTIRRPKPGKRKPGGSGQKASSTVHNNSNMNAQSSCSVGNANSKEGTSEEDVEKNEILVAVETLHETKTEPVISDDDFEPGTRIINTTVLPGASILPPSFSNPRPELGTSHMSSGVLPGAGSLPVFNAGISGGPEMRIAVTNSPIMPGTGGMSLYRHARPELGTSHTNSSMLQGASSHPWFSSNYRF